MEVKQRTTTGMGTAAPILSGLLYAFLVMSIAAVATSLILLLTNQKESSLPTYAYIIHCISLLLGGWISGKRAEMRGWYYGGLLGLIYALLVILIGFLGFDKGFDLQTLFFGSFAFGIGAIGGILGVNTKK